MFFSVNSKTQNLSTSMKGHTLECDHKVAFKDIKLLGKESNYHLIEIKKINLQITRNLYLPEMFLILFYWLILSGFITYLCFYYGFIFKIIARCYYAYSNIFGKVLFLYKVLTLDNGSCVLRNVTISNIIWICYNHVNI